MSESVADETQESVTAGAEEAVEATPEAAATDFELQATEYKNRFAGSQKKLTETLNAMKAKDAELEALRSFKAQAERANMSEIDRLKAELQDAQNAAAAARSEAQRASLAARFPQSFATLGEATPLDETVLTALEAKLSGGEEESEAEVRIDPNRPAKAAPAARDPLAAANDWLVGTLNNIGGI